MKFTHKENVILTEVCRRLNVFKKGNLHEPLVITAFPYEVKKLVSIGILTPDSTLAPRIRTWYKLGHAGKELFKNYIFEISDKESLSFFTGKNCIDFNERK